MRNLYLLTIIILVSCTFSRASAQTNESLQSLVDRALGNNHLVQSASEEFRAEKKTITSKYNLANPAIGINNLNRGLETEYITVQQMIRFPTKYLLEGKAQKRKAQAYQSKFDYTKLKLREDVVNTYYELHSVQKTLEITRANLEIVKDFARVAEKKYASGNSSQADSMKAHFEITQLEIDLLRLEQEEVRLQSEMRVLLSDPSIGDLQLVKNEVNPPVVDFPLLTRHNLQLQNFVKNNSPILQAQEKMMESAQYKRSLAKWEFAPDFNVQYQERIAGLPENSKIISFNATIPLWFWKNTSEASAASAKANAEEFKYKDLTMKVIARFQYLKARIEKNSKTLKIYKTTLMPQAEGAYRSSRFAYKAGKTTFLNLLDSERSLYRVKQDYFKNLSQFVKDITEMESLLGRSISNIYGIKGVLQ